VGSIWIHIIFPIIATISYGILFNVPKKALIGGGLIGMCGWLVVYELRTFYLSAVAASLIAGFLVATLSQLIAKPFKLPSTNFSIAGIIPLVPGSKAYRTMRSFVEGDYVGGLALGAETFLSAGAIAAGLMISLSIFSIGKGKGIGWQHGTRHS
jgi:uncharacterized membrane protein YjjB (DUF3815 family)